MEQHNSDRAILLCWRSYHIKQIASSRRLPENYIFGYKIRATGYVQISSLHENGFETAYAHPKDPAKKLNIGKPKFTRGEQIGSVGNSGRCTAPHLHYELFYQGKLIDPLPGG